MQTIQLVLLVSTLSLVRASRYGLLRVGSAHPSATHSIQSGMHSNSKRTLFDEDFSLAFRQLFGSQSGLSLSMAEQNGAQLSLSMLMGQAAAQLSLSLGSTAAAAAMLDGMFSDGVADIGYDTTQTAPNNETDEDDFTFDPSSIGLNGSLGPETIAALAAVGAVALVGLLVALMASLGSICPI